MSLLPLGPRMVSLGVVLPPALRINISIKSGAAVTQDNRGVVVPQASYRRLKVDDHIRYVLFTQSAEKLQVEE